jgi:hypothetical protein
VHPNADHTTLSLNVPFFKYINHSNFCSGQDIWRLYCYCSCFFVCLVGWFFFNCCCYFLC